MKPFILFCLLMLFLFCLQNCGVKEFNSSSRPISHELWDSLLKSHVLETGEVNYEGILQDSAAFNRYIRLLSSNHPNAENWPETDRLAYWINAYNAFTVKLVLDHYPVKSIKDIKGGVPFVNSVWDIKFIRIEGADYLNNIEHSILRKRFNEPRIHFAINCASVSCPRLRNEAFLPDKLEAQLTDQARYFLNNPVKNIITPEKMQLSKIFSWFSGDFTKNGKLIDFLNQYAPVKIRDDAKKEFLDYNWQLNGQ